MTETSINLARRASGLDVEERVTDGKQNGI